MNRRGFLQTCLALCAAPAIVRADSLMRVVPRETIVEAAYNSDLIALLERRIYIAGLNLAAHLDGMIYSSGKVEMALIDESNLVEIAYARRCGLVPARA